MLSIMVGMRIPKRRGAFFFVFLFFGILETGLTHTNLRTHVPYQHSYNFGTHGHELMRLMIDFGFMSFIINDQLIKVK